MMKILTDVLLFCLVSHFCYAGERKVTLNSGNTAIVPTAWGDIAHQSNNFFKILEIEPKIDRFSSPRLLRLVWHIHIHINREFKGTIKMTAPIPSSLNVPKDIKNYEFPGQFAFDWFGPDGSLDGWKWLNDPGDTWIQFNFTILAAGLENSIEFIDFARVKEKHKKEMLAFLKNSQKTLINKVDIKTVVLSTGESLQLPMIGGEALRYTGDRFQIDSLSPVVDPNNSYVWLLEGYYYNNTESILEISAPWIKPAYFSKVKLSGRGKFTIPIAPIISDPEFWTWLHDDSDFWLPIKINIHKDIITPDINIIEWCHINNKTRLLLINQNSSGQRKSTQIK